jgi:nucleotide-binding universal stress UspA family protein
MAMKILIAVCNCELADQTVKYAAEICSGETDVLYTLYHVQPLIPRQALKKIEAHPKAMAEAEALVRESTKAAKSALKRFRETMVHEGVKERLIHLLSAPMQLGIAKDILDKAEDGSYDAIVLGRQGITPNNDPHVGSIAGKVVEHALRVPVWVVSGGAKSTRVLLAVDGSQNSLRALDYVLGILGGHPELKVTLFHVPVNLKYWEIVMETGRSYDVVMEKPYLQECFVEDDNRRMKVFYDQAYAKMDAAGLGKKQIETKVRIWGYDIATAILEEASGGNYGTVVVGRRGEREAFFSGQTVTRLLQNISEQALWVIP